MPFGTGLLVGPGKYAMEILHCLHAPLQSPPSLEANMIANQNEAPQPLSEETK